MRRCIVFIAVLVIAGCGDAGDDVTDIGVGAGEYVDLPPPRVTGGSSLTETLAERRSVRDYDPVGLDAEEMSQLLWAIQGVTSSAGQRTAPSAGGLYPLEVYLVTANGRYHYLPDDHRLEVVGGDDVRQDLSRAALSQEPVAVAPAVFVVAAVYSRTEGRYGDRAERYVHLEAGHAAQNILLQAVALGLGAVPIGAFHEADVQAVLDLPPDHEPLYLIPVGRPLE